MCLAPHQQEGPQLQSSIPLLYIHYNSQVWVSHVMGYGRCCREETVSVCNKKEKKMYMNYPVAKTVKITAYMKIH